MDSITWAMKMMTPSGRAEQARVDNLYDEMQAYMKIDSLENLFKAIAMAKWGDLELKEMRTLEINQWASRWPKSATSVEELKVAVQKNAKSALLWSGGGKVTNAQAENERIRTLKEAVKEIELLQ